MLVGKGIVYDTGGADVKTGGMMAGMHRDKGGSSVVAGFFQALAILKPKGLKVLGRMCMVRNSIGAESYVADEIIKAQSGQRVRVTNTDAEGRLAMADALNEMRIEAETAVNPCLMTLATLTGHAMKSYGNGYSALMGNQAAIDQGLVMILYYY